MLPRQLALLSFHYCLFKTDVKTLHLSKKNNSMQVWNDMRASTCLFMDPLFLYNECVVLYLVTCVCVCVCVNLLTGITSPSLTDPLPNDPFCKLGLPKGRQSLACVPRHQNEGGAGAAGHPVTLQRVPQLLLVRRVNTANQPTTNQP